MATDPVSDAGSDTPRRSPVHPKRIAAGAASRPASSTGILGAALVILAKKLGVNLDTEEAVVLVAATARIVEWLTERFVK